MSLARNQFRVLTYLAARQREIAGVEVADGLESVGRSSVYAALAALQRDGLVTARWDLSGSHPRRMMQISGSGRQALTDERRTDARLRAGRAGGLA